VTAACPTPPRKVQPSCPRRPFAANEAANRSERISPQRLSADTNACRSTAAPLFKEESGCTSAPVQTTPSFFCKLEDDVVY
jgi:hypothetical protein